MQIVVIAGGKSQTELQDKQIPAGVRVNFFNTLEEVKSPADAYFYLLEEEELANDFEHISKLEAPVFVNAVKTTLADLPENASRICAWPGLLLNEAIEVCSSKQNLEAASQILDRLQWKFELVPDVAGMIAPRTIAVIVNEAFITVDENMSNKNEIETAMRLGINFPHGPFGWAEKIGIKKIFNLLTYLSTKDSRYTPAPLLIKEISNLGLDS